MHPRAWRKIVAADPRMADDFNEADEADFKLVESPLGQTARVSGYVQVQVLLQSKEDKTVFEPRKILFLLLDIGEMDVIVGRPSIKMHQMALRYKEVFGLDEDSMAANEAWWKRSDYLQRHVMPEGYGRRNLTLEEINEIKRQREDGAPATPEPRRVKFKEDLAALRPVRSEEAHGLDYCLKGEQLVLKQEQSIRDEAEAVEKILRRADPSGRSSSTTTPRPLRKNQGATMVAAFNVSDEGVEKRTASHRVRVDAALGALLATLEDRIRWNPSQDKDHIAQIVSTEQLERDLSRSHSMGGS
jgi:hypothetical protein